RHSYEYEVLCLAMEHYYKAHANGRTCENCRLTRVFALGARFGGFEAGSFCRTGRKKLPEKTKGTEGLRCR
ncbi:MAG TPA: hypothetical protein PKH05_14315, partial [Nitrospira sp.]|nr:hypothetical protein [Nitrospira sp.]